MDSIRQILARLNEHEVDFAVIGGVVAGAALCNPERGICEPVKDPGFRPRA